MTLTSRRWPKYSLLKFVHNGGWFCHRCDRVVSIDDEREEPSCPHCKKQTLKYYPPVKELL